MPSSRRMRVSLLIALLTLVIIFYVTTGASSTQNSAFYQRTLAALREKESSSAADRQDAIAEERVRNARVGRLQLEHEIAMAQATTKSGEESGIPEPIAQAQQTQTQKTQTQTQAQVKTQTQTRVKGSTQKSAAAELSQPRPAAGAQQKVVAGGAAAAAGKVSSPGSGAGSAGSEKSVAGRKKMPADNKVVEGKPAAAEGHDGVAKVGNIAPSASNVVSGAKSSHHTEEDHLVETTLNDILKKGPIIIFSKTYCPFSKKAKHILQDLYTITPPPYVVELDEHDLGPRLQDALEKATGRHTVPNILINGKSIGGGDDIEALHNSGKIVETVLSMGGKRIMTAEKKVASSAGDGQGGAGIPFKA